MKTVPTQLKKLFQVVLVLVVFVLAGMTAVAASSPLEQIKSSVDQILDLMNNASLKAPEKLAERRTLIIVVVDKRFDFVEMSKRSLAKYWKSISEEEQKQFVALFSEILKLTYIGRVESYSDESFLYKKEILKKNKAEVQTSFVKNDLEVPINYRLYTNDVEWFVYDVVIEGVSLVNNYRSQFDPIMEKEKFPGLVVKLNEKLDKMRAADKGNE